MSSFFRMILLVACLINGSSLTPEAVQATTIKSENQAKIFGTVVDQETLRPIPGATVRIEEKNQIIFELTTGGDGSFEAALNNPLFAKKNSHHCFSNSSSHHLMRNEIPHPTVCPTAAHLEI